MKLFFYSHFFPPSIGGVEVIVLSLARGLAELCAPDGKPEFDVTLVTQTSRGNFDDSKLPFRVVRKPGLRTLATLVRESDVLHLAGPALAPLALGSAFGKPVVVEHHGFQAICPNGLLLVEPTQSTCPGHFMAGHHKECFSCNSGLGTIGSLKLWLLTFVRRFLCQHASVNITPTDWLEGQLQLPRMETVHHGLEPYEFSSNLKPSQVGTPIIAYAGRLVTTKGIRILLQAVRLLREQGRTFELHVIGEGPELPSLELAASTPPLAGYVRIFGRLSSQDMNAVLSRARIVVVPSLAGEVFGLVVAENMQRGLPVVASDLGAFQELLGDTGIIFRTGDATDLAHRLSGIINDPERALLLGERARSRIESEFNYAKMVNGHAEIYRSLFGT